MTYSIRDISIAPTSVARVALAGLLLAAASSAVLTQAYRADAHLLTSAPSETASAPLALSPKQPAVAALDLARLDALAMMGKPAPPPPPPQPSTIEEVPETQLGLRLAGIMASDQPHLTAAMIAVNDKMPTYFRIGDEISPGIVIADISRQGVMLRRQDDLEKLVFKHAQIWQSFGPNSPTQSMEHREVVADTSQPAAAPVGGAQSDQISASAPDASSVSAGLSLQERLQRLRAQLKQS